MAEQLQGSFEKFVDWRQCATVMQRGIKAQQRYTGASPRNFQTAVVCVCVCVYMERKSERERICFMYWAPMKTIYSSSDLTELKYITHNFAVKMWRFVHIYHKAIILLENSEILMRRGNLGHLMMSWRDCHLIRRKYKCHKKDTD
jgi:hypothetical protein